jgi:hypothetical protein
VLSSELHMGVFFCLNWECLALYKTRLGGIVSSTSDLVGGVNVV